MSLFDPFGGGGNSSSSVVAQNTTATGTGKAVNQSPNSVQTGDSSIAVGAGGKYTEQGALDVSGNHGNITIGDTKGILSLADRFAATTQGIVNSSNSANLASNSNFLKGVQELALSQQTGGFTPVIKTFLWLALGGIVLLAFVFRKK